MDRRDPPPSAPQRILIAPRFSRPGGLGKPRPRASAINPMAKPTSPRLSPSMLAFLRALERRWSDDTIEALVAALDEAA